MDVTRTCLMLLATLVVAAQSTASAQEMPLDGSRPPVVSLAEATRGSSDAAAVDSSFVEPEGPAASSATPAVGPGVIADVARRAEAPKPRQTFRPPPATLSMDSGKNSTFAIAKDHINRLVTPFAKPTLRTTSTASSSIEGSIVYIATPLDTPISLFVFDESAPEYAISLTLVPQDDIPPVSTVISVNGWNATGGSSRRAPSREQALAREGQHPYLETLTTVLRDVAKGIVPDGYGYESLTGYPTAGQPSCAIPGVHVQTMQLLVGGAYRVYVAKATNTSYTGAEISEDMCSGRELRAVAAWPATTLAPGQSTELYMVVGAQSDPYESVTRPSLLGSN